MRFFIDECLSPQLARRLNESGQHEAVHPLHVGRRGEDDAAVLARCIAEDRIIVTGNAGDFRKLAARKPSTPVSSSCLASTARRAGPCSCGPLPI